MGVLRVQAVTLAAVVLLSGCALWPSAPGQMGDTAPAADSPSSSTASAGTGDQTPARGISGGVPSADIANRRPLVVIRFDRPDVSYEQPVQNAVSEMLDRRPDASIDLVAFAPSRGGSARASLESTELRGQAENVMRSLVGMGLPPSRIALLASTSPNAATNEVHLYVR